MLQLPHSTHSKLPILTWWHTLRYALPAVAGGGAMAPTPPAVRATLARRPLAGESSSTLRPAAVRGEVEVRARPDNAGWACAGKPAQLSVYPAPLPCCPCADLLPPSLRAAGGLVCSP